MRLLTGLLGGVLAGAVGAAAWAAVVYFSNYELGILAIAVGAIVGVGVLIGSGREGGSVYGMLAAAIAIAAVLAGKWAWVGLTTSGPFDNQFMISEVANLIIEERREAGQPVDHLHNPKPTQTLRADYERGVWSEAASRWDSYSAAEKERYRRVPSMLNPHVHLVRLADDVCKEYENEGRTLNWPDDHDISTAWRESHYPKDVWAEAVRRWNAWSYEDQQTYLAWIEQEDSRHQREFLDAIRPEVFRESFSMYDALWLILAVAAAYGIAARSEEE